MKTRIIYYSKKGCTPCEIHFKMFERKFKVETFKKIILETNEEALNIVNKYNTRHVPFIVINEKTVIHTDDLKTLLYCIRSI